MAAYAALVSLINNIHQIKNHPRISTLFEEKQLESLLKRVDSLLVFIESHNSYGASKDEAEDLERQITSAAHAAEDVIENHIVDHIEIMMIQFPIEDQVAGLIIQSVIFDLEKIIQDVDSIREMVVKVELPPVSSMAAALSRPPSAGKINMVGFDGYSTQLFLKLMGHQPDRQIIPIVGMGGIGKTTLARNAYDSLSVVRHFIFRAWVVISQACILRDFLCEILSCLGQSKDEIDKMAEHELRELLYKTLYDRRYLIVLDDMWSIEAWDMIKFFFPNNCNGSRILVTTRISGIANYFDSIPIELKLLDDDQSWKLFCAKVFPLEDCPAELEESGKEIVRKCRGLPLAIAVIGGLLGNSSRTKYHWENVAKDISSTLNTIEDDTCFKLLSLSYSHLPACLKPCYLYLGIFPEDDVIRVSRLIKLWVAEGFIKPNEDQILEDVAESYVKNLVDRNLIFVDSFQWNGKVKTFRIHDLLRDLCIKVAEKEKFLCVITSELDTPQDMDRQRRVIIHGNTYEEQYLRGQVLGTLKSQSLPRSLIVNQGRGVYIKSRLFRVLAGVYCNPRDDIFEQVNLRFSAQEHCVWLHEWMLAYKLPSSISLLWNVQTLLMLGRAACVVDAPSEIWEMPQLRHLMFNLIRLPEPPPSDGIVLHNLQTLGKVSNFLYKEEACTRMPNIKKLHVYFEDFNKDSGSFASFSKLESLHCELRVKKEQVNLMQYLKFPDSVKKLKLTCFELQWEDLTVIGSLPNLEVLILICSVTGTNWNPVTGKFLRLRCLQIHESDLICWNADETPFPVLENLVLDRLYFLNEIPLCVGDIPTLEQISLAYCSDSCALSALKILKEQLDFGNKGLQVKVCRGEKEAKEFMEQVEAEGLTGLDFQLDAS